jgi:hypothetical protein
MNKYKNLHITTGGNFILEYDRICRLSQTKNDGQIINFENAVGKEACTAQRKSISDSRFFLQSGSMDPYDDRNYKGRFKNFNIIYKEIGNPDSIKIGYAETVFRHGQTNTLTFHSSFGSLQTKIRF